jgi:hypothetical protein
MLLNEFFGKSIDIKNSNDSKDAGEKNISDELFWFILDHDKLHKDYFHPLAKKIKQSYQTENLNKPQLVKEFLTMVNRGCMEFYHKNKMSGRPEILFPKELREELCERLYDHYCEDIKKDRYKLG